MGPRPVGGIERAPSPGSWKLAPKPAKDAQGFVVSAFSDLDGAVALLLRLAGDRGGAWLKALQEVCPITRGDGDRSQTRAATIAFTRTGLDALGVPETAVASFPLPFQEGMMQADRRRRLGDAPPPLEDEPEPPPPLWSANTPQQCLEAQDPKRLDPKGLKTGTTVHAILILYGETGEAASALAATVTGVLTADGVAVARQHRLELHADRRGVPHEHFGFSDGVSQPIPFGDGTAEAGGGPYPRDPLHGVPLGEVLLGYANAHGEIPPGPVVDGTGRVGQVDGGDRDTDSLDSVAAAGLRDLGLNGSYLVVRELRQDVPAFWGSLDREAAALNARNPGSAPVDADWLAAKVVGRDKDGNVLVPADATAPLPASPPGAASLPAAGMPDNDFAFFRRDRYGDGCPIGSHVRRANPRDTLAAVEDDCGTLLNAANNHRILRRGRKYGKLLKDSRIDDGQERGLLFMCLNTDFERQFEFIQQNWLLNPNFGTLFQQIDPLVGPKGPMTVPARPLRRMVEVETYVTLVGGDYFFLPSLTVLDYFATLPPKPDGPQAGASG